MHRGNYSDSVSASYLAIINFHNEVADDFAVDWNESYDYHVRVTYTYLSLYTTNYEVHMNQINKQKVS